MPYVFSLHWLIWDPFISTKNLFFSMEREFPFLLLKAVGYCHLFFTLKTLSHIQMNTFNFSPKGTSSVDLAEHLVTWVSPKESKSVGEFRDNFRHFMHWRIKLGGNQAWFSCADLINGQSSEESLSSIRVKARQDGHSHATYMLSNIDQRLHLFESFN